MYQACTNLGEGLDELLRPDVGEPLQLDVGQLLGEDRRRRTHLTDVRLRSGQVRALTQGRRKASQVRLWLILGQHRVREIAILPDLDWK